MPLYRVTNPAAIGSTPRVLTGLGEFKPQVPRDIELADERAVAAFLAKGFLVEPVYKPPIKKTAPTQVGEE